MSGMESCYRKACPHSCTCSTLTPGKEVDDVAEWLGTRGGEGQVALPQGAGEARALWNMRAFLPEVEGCDDVLSSTPPPSHHHEAFQKGRLFEKWVSLQAGG